MTLAPIAARLMVAPKPPDGLRAINVACPYCETGWAVVMVAESDGLDRNIKALQDPRQCCRCSKYFRIGTQVTLHGMKIEGE